MKPNKPFSGDLISRRLNSRLVRWRGVRALEWPQARYIRASQGRCERRYRRGRGRANWPEFEKGRALPHNFGEYVNPLYLADSGLIVLIVSVVPDNVVFGLNRKFHLAVNDVLGEGRGRDEFVLGVE